MNDMGTEILQVLRIMQAAATLCANTFESHSPQARPFPGACLKSTTDYLETTTATYCAGCTASAPPSGCNARSTNAPSGEPATRSS